MTDGDETRLTLRLPESIVAWLEDKQKSLRGQGLDVPLSVVARQQLEMAKRQDGERTAPAETITHPGPRKAKPRK